MKVRKILSVLCIAALVISQGTISAMSLNDSETENTEVQDVQKEVITEKMLKSALIVEEKIYDGKTTANVSFDSSNLFGDEDVGVNKTISITNIKVIGENADKYSLEVKKFDIKKQTIKRLPIILTPDDEDSNGRKNYHSIIDGIVSDSKIQFKKIVLDDDTNQLIKNDGYSVNNNLKAFIVKYSENGVEKYGYSFKDGELKKRINATVNNYEYAIDPDAVPMVGDADAPQLLPAIVSSDNDTIISEVDNIRIVSNGSVKLKLFASANNNKSPVFFTVKRKMPGEDSYSTIVESVEGKTESDTDQNNRFVYSAEGIEIPIPENTG